MGVILSNPPIPLEENEEVQLIATVSGILGIPNFRLKWRSSEASQTEEIPTENLYPSILEPVCLSEAFLMNLDCVSTFTQMESGVVRVNCPPGCLAEEPVPKVYGTPTCYALSSSVCVAAIHGNEEQCISSSCILICVL